jgi:hypothetical protein
MYGVVSPNLPAWHLLLLMLLLLLLLLAFDAGHIAGCLPPRHQDGQRCG